MSFHLYEQSRVLKIRDKKQSSGFHSLEKWKWEAGSGCRVSYARSQEPESSNGSYIVNLFNNTKLIHFTLCTVAIVEK